MKTTITSEYHLKDLIQLCIVHTAYEHDLNENNLVAICLRDKDGNNVIVINGEMEDTL